MKDIFPNLKEKYGDHLNEMWFIQGPGELVFVPGGWWHTVVNLDDTIAITQNYCNSVNFETVWKFVRKERKKMAVKFLRKLKKSYHNLYEIAKILNDNDNFIMYDDLKKIKENRKFLGIANGNDYDNDDMKKKRRGSSSSSSSSSSSESSSSNSSSSRD